MIYIYMLLIFTMSSRHFLGTIEAHPDIARPCLHGGPSGWRAGECAPVVSYISVLPRPREDDL